MEVSTSSKKTMHLLICIYVIPTFWTQYFLIFSVRSFDILPRNCNQIIESHHWQYRIAKNQHQRASPITTILDPKEIGSCNIGPPKEVGSGERWGSMEIVLSTTYNFTCWLLWNLPRSHLKIGCWSFHDDYETFFVPIKYLCMKLLFSLQFNERLFWNSRIQTTMH